MIELFACAPVETTEDHPHGHHHHHHHPHPYAEPPSPSAPPPADDDAPSASVDDADAEAAVLPSRLDRLIAFLDSYFGQVELIRPSSSSPPAPPAAETEEAKEKEKDVTTAEQLKPEPVDDATLPPEKVEDALHAEAEAEAKATQQRAARPAAPVIRVTLDSYHADVRVEDLVRFPSRSSWPLSLTGRR